MTMKYWKKLSHDEICDRIFNALDQNVDYKTRNALGVPASYLDEKVFFTDPVLLKQAPFMSSLIRNPNHIGCHTVGESEQFFKGTQEIERELINLCAIDILKGEDEQYDGYVASGGTEANIQAIWMYRNLYRNEDGISSSDIALIFSEDAHYSMYKAANLLNLRTCIAEVNYQHREINAEKLEKEIDKQIEAGVKHFIVVANMMTTMFGSVDMLYTYLDILKKRDVKYKVHIDGAYGGFVYPFISKRFELTFKNPEVSSITLDAHKMVQAPYGTGIFICRKDLIHNVMTDQAKYVQGMDVTLSGSRSGANAISVWMILQTYGPNGWHEKIHLLSYRTDWLEKQLLELDIRFHRTERSNIITINADQFPPIIALKHGLVPDAHGDDPNWFKIVVMDHVTIDALEPFIEDLKIWKQQDY